MSRPLERTYNVSYRTYIDGFAVDCVASEATKDFVKDLLNQNHTIVQFIRLSSYDD